MSHCTLTNVLYRCSALHVVVEVYKDLKFFHLRTLTRLGYFDFRQKPNKV